MAKVKHWYGLLSAYTAIGTKDGGTLYHVYDEGAIYRGTTVIVRSGNTLNTTSTAQTKAGALTITGALTANGGIATTTGTFSGLITPNGGISGVYQIAGQSRTNLGTPIVEEMALFEGMFSNKLRFTPPTLQEQTTDGTTWVASSRGTTQQLADLMIGGGQTTTIPILPASSPINAGYRLTFDWATNGVGYVALSYFYTYLCTYGNTVTISIEAYSFDTGTWRAISSGTASGWPTHFSLKHTSLWCVNTTTHDSKVRVTFKATSAFNTYGCDINALEWFGGYPAAKRSVESYTSSKAVSFPANITSAATVIADKISITNTSGTNHLTFGRASANYITAPASGFFVFQPNGNAVGTAGSPMILDYANAYAGTNDGINLGTSASRWKNVYSVLGNFSGAITASASLSVGTTLAVTGATTISNTLTLAVGLNTVTRSSQAVGSISFSSYNSGAYLPAIVSKSDTNAALYFVGMTADANLASADVIFGVRRTDDVDFTTITGKTAFSFRRYATTLLDIMRDGSATLLGAFTAPSVHVSGIIRSQDAIVAYGDATAPYYSTFLEAGIEDLRTGIQWGNEANSTYGSWIRFMVNDTTGVDTPVYPLALGHTVCAFTTDLTVAGTLTVTGSIIVTGTVTASAFIEA